jgi:hypothetical protein
MSYIPKKTWVRDEQGVFKEGLKNNGIIVCHAGVEIDGEIAFDIERLENQTKKIPQNNKAETKAIAENTANVKIEITEEKPKQIKKKNANTK